MQVKFYLVGGAVRDKFLGVQSKDLDFSVELPDFESMVAWVKSIGGEIFLATPEYNTLRARIGKIAADFVLCRKDGPYGDDRRRPQWTEPGTIYNDLERRDFTINAIAQECRIKDGQIVFTDNFLDPHEGVLDLNSGLIRCVGNPADRFREDTLRVIRALRFAVTKGLQIDFDVAHHIYHTEPKAMAEVSFERRKDELTKMFRYNPVAALRQLQTLPDDLLNAMFADGLWMQVTNKAK